jgi:CRP/FNR family cyclic AMP-dependent transcriptional regulator
MSALGRGGTVAILDEDPDLALGVDESELEAARLRAVARVIELDPPSWDPTPIQETATAGWLGLFVLEGLLLRRVRVGRRFACELFGPGDLVRPWDTDSDYEPLPISVDWLVLRRVRLAVLDSGFMARIARWPAINSNFVSRVAQRARGLALTQAVSHLPRAYSRLLILFWLLAERWGKVTTDGIYVTLPVTHEVLAMLIGAQRPTVTIALQRLTRAGLLIREGSDRWLLTNRAITTLKQPESLELVETGDESSAD